MPEGEIVVTYKTIDRFYERRAFRTLEGARKYAHRRVGPHPDVSLNFGYAVSYDGIGKVELRGASFSEVFPEPK